MERKYAIIDVETTGGDFRRDRIIEIAIVIHDGEKELDRFESFVNPERSIPYNITRLTGIYQEMVEDAPYFYEIAKQIVLLTEGCIFVAHNVRFDYSFIRYEFERLGFTYSRKRLCTVKLARRNLDLKSCGMDSLIRHFGIEVEQRHRAMGDAAALAEMFPKLMGSSEDKSVNEELHENLRNNQIPPGLKLEQFFDLPEDPGVYYLLDREGRPLYIGKSKNIKKRLSQHFRAMDEKTLRLYESVYDISLEMTGSGFIAELLEAAEIKKHLPALNRAQRSRKDLFFSYVEENNKGLYRLRSAAIEEIHQYDSILFYHRSKKAAKGFLRGQLYNLNLCECLQNTGQHRPESCITAQVGQCPLIQKEADDLLMQEYNERFEDFLNKMKKYPVADGVIFVDSIRYGEKDFILIENNTYQGFGTLHEEAQQITDFEELKSHVQSFKETRDVIGIINKHLRKKLRSIRVYGPDQKEVQYA